MRKRLSSIRAKFTITFISILVFSCITSLLLVVIIAKYVGGFFPVMQDKGVLLHVALLLCAAIGSLLMFYATKFISRPIKNISETTKEIAKGNFDVKINYTSDDEIGVLANNFNLMTEELKKIEYLRKDFITNVSHEFKTPIASIQGFVEMIKDENLARDKFHEYTDIIIEETKRLNNLSANILRISKLDNQVIQNKKTTFSLDEQLRKTILLFEEQWSKKQLELDIQLEKVAFTGDEELVQQIWINLIGNAVKFSHQNGTVTISLKQVEDSGVVEIKDEGIGISEESKSRIFEKFYQADPSRSQTGNGLGLAIVKRIIEICKGTITFESKLDEGTCFTVTLPK
jgi:signal transduction histidine kinase